MKYRHSFILGAAAAVLSACILYYHQAVSAPAQTDNTLQINVIPLKRQNVVISNQYVGYVTPIHSVDLVPNVAGYIDEVFVLGGQEVRSGDNLVLIDQREYKAQLDAASSAVSSAKANYVNAESYYKRLQKAGTKAISAATLDDAKAKFLAAQAAFKQAKAEEQRTKVLYDYTVLQAPIDGIVGNVALTKGNYVAPASAPLLSIVQFNPIRVMFAISDKEYLNEVKQHPNDKLFGNEQISIKLSNGKLYPIAGKFRFTDNQVNKATNSVTVFVDFDNANRELMPNSYVDVVLSKKLNDVFLIRQNYVTLNDKGAFVYTIQNGKFKQTPLNITGYLGNDYVADNNFAEGEFLVVDKVDRIAAGTKVKMNVIQPKEGK